MSNINEICNEKHSEFTMNEINIYVCIIPLRLCLQIADIILLNTISLPKHRRGVFITNSMKEDTHN